MKHLITHDCPIPLTKEQINKPQPSTDVKSDACQRTKDAWLNLSRAFSYYGYGHKPNYTVTYTDDNQIKHIKYD